MSTLPEKMANSGVHFRIYNPSYQEWLFVSNDILNGDNMIESHPSELEDGNRFILVNHQSSRCYGIYNLTYNKYLFISFYQSGKDHYVEAHGVDEINERADRNGFRFIPGDTSGGTFKIFNPSSSEFLFVSNEKSGRDHMVEGHPHENEERNKFQLQIISK